MGPFSAGEVVLLPFPFSNLQRSKVRPALLLAKAGSTDWIACQVTSNPFADARAFELTQNHFISGGLQRTSYVRPGKIFTADESIFIASAGMLNHITLTSVRDICAQVVRGESFA